MEVKDVQNLKKDIEKGIKDLIDHFEKETGLSVGYIDVERFSSGDKKRKVKSVHFSANLE